MSFLAKNILPTAYGIPPEGSVDYLKSKVSRFSFDWWETLNQSNEKAFTVAKATQADVLDSIRGAVEKSLESGQTFQDFQKELTPTLQKLGWWGKTKEGHVLGTPYRLKNIYRTNIQQSFNAGREKKLLASRTTPFSKYLAVLDNRTRPSHGALNGVVAANDSSFWATYTPSNGYQCRCRKQGVSERQIQRQGLKVSDFEGKIGSKEVPINKSKGIFAQVSTVKVNGKTVSPDAGFSSNPLSAWSPDVKKYPTKIAAPLKKDLKKAGKAAKKKSQEQVSEKKAKKAIKAANKPKDLKETLQNSNEFLKKWEKEIPRVQDFSLQKAEDGSGMLTLNGDEVRFGDFAKAKKIEKALRAKSFRLQADGVAKVQKSLGDFSEIASLKEVQNALSKHVRAAQKNFEGLEDPPFLDIQIGKDFVVVGSDKIQRWRVSEKEIKYLEEFLKLPTATEQFNYAKLQIMRREIEPNQNILILAETKARGMIEQNAFEKAKFLGYNLQSSSLPSGFAPTKLNRNVLFGEKEKELQSRLKLAESFLSKNFANEILPHEAISHLETTLNGGSSYYEHTTRKIIFSMQAQKADTIVHEMVHHLHFQNPRIEKVVEDFFKERTKGEFLTESQLFSDQRLRDSWSDEYMGKLYFYEGDQKTNYLSKNGDFDFDEYKKNYPFPIGTELLTKGIQEFFFSRSDLYARDPEFFELISAILRGEIPQ